VDRLDSWLNSQVGWRRAVLIWLQLSIPLIGCGCSLWSLITPGVPGLGLGFLEAVAWSVLAAALATGIVLAVEHSRATRHSDRPVLSWRFSAAMLCMTAQALLGELTNQQPYWPRIHRVVDIVSMVLILGGLTFGIEAARRYRRLRRGNVSGGQAGDQEQATRPAGWP
jgi:hypothetical protein